MLESAEERIGIGRPLRPRSLSGCARMAMIGYHSRLNKELDAQLSVSTIGAVGNFRFKSDPYIAPGQSAPVGCACERRFLKKVAAG